MNVCKCGREFSTKYGLSYHKNFCGKDIIFLDGGYQCYIGKDGEKVYIHREVMENKLGRKLKKGELVHHKDTVKLNNDPDNLELSTESTHGKIHYNLKTDKQKYEFARSNPEGKGKKLKGSEHPNSKLDENKVKEIKLKLNEGNTQTSIAKEFNIDRSVIRAIKYRRSWKHVT